MNQSIKTTFRKLTENKVQLIVQIFISFLIGLFLSHVNLDSVEFYLYDIRMRLTSQIPEQTHASIVHIDNLTIEKLQGEPTWHDINQFIKTIEKANPLAIVFNIDPLLIQGSDRDIKNFNLLNENNYVLFTTEQLALKGENSLALNFPLNKIKLQSAPKTADQKVFSKDGITRRMLISYQEKEMMHVVLAKKLLGDKFKVENINGLFTFLDAEQAWIHFFPHATFPKFSFSKASEIPIRDIMNKVIFVGNDTNKSFKDYIMTPLSRDPVAMTTTEMHAHMFESLIQNKTIIRTPTYLQSIITIIVSILTLLVVLNLKPIHGLVILLGLFSTINLIALFLFLFNIWLNIAQPLIAIFLCYYFFIPYRLIIENRRSWEYYQKHQLLRQVEELKTNFISMMSHDLKTPIARILGMTDLILKDSNTLSSEQREAIDTIKLSSNDLLGFINAILQYGRVESEKIQLHYESKDINEIIQETVKKHDFLSKIKKIQIHQELEPLFPIDIDSELIKQVLSNLIENAIKYSPEESKVLITSEEKGDFIQIQVSDQGPGIPEDELTHIFLKFFRSKNAKTSPIKGSGLGLYLAKYFTELHGGIINVESKLGQGTTFIVELPQVQRRGNAKSTNS